AVAYGNCNIDRSTDAWPDIVRGHHVDMGQTWAVGYRSGIRANWRLCIRACGGERRRAAEFVFLLPAGRRSDVDAGGGCPCSEGKVDCGGRAGGHPADLRGGRDGSSDLQPWRILAAADDISRARAALHRWFLGHRFAVPRVL